MSPIIHVGGLDVPAYTLMVLIGFCAGYVAVARRGRLYGVSADEVAAAYLLAAIGSLLGGKALFMLQGLPSFLEQNALGETSFLEFVEGAGLVFYGGLAGCLFFLYLAGRAFRTSFWTETDILLPALPLAQAFGRVGCFLAGCCYGVPSDFGFVMRTSVGELAGVRLLPVQLMESACTFALFLILMRMGRTKRAPGQILGTYLLGYGTARFLLEFLRYDTIRGYLGILSLSQWLSMIAIAAGVILLVRCRRNSRTALTGVS